MDNELKAVTGTTATISYECTFDDNTKKTVTIGSYRTADLPNTLAENVKTFNSNASVTFRRAFISSSSGAQFNRISACTVTVTTRNVLI